jgi:hypothetical protein
LAILFTQAAPSTAGENHAFKAPDKGDGLTLSFLVPHLLQQTYRGSHSKDLGACCLSWQTSIATTSKSSPAPTERLVYDVGHRIVMSRSMSSPEKRLWWYIEEDDSWGPVTQDALQDLVVSGRLGHSFLVWSPGLDDWRPIDSVAELGALFQPPPSPGYGQRWPAWSLEQQNTVFNPPDPPHISERTPRSTGPATVESDSRTSPPPVSTPDQHKVVAQPEDARDESQSAATEPPIVVIDYSERITSASPPPIAPLMTAGPWRRFFARVLDLLWESAIVAAVPLWLLPAKLWTSPYAILALVLGTIPLALVIHALMSAMFGTTPGKALFNVRRRSVQRHQLSR